MNEGAIFYDHLDRRSLIGYCGEHCKSERALFRKDMVAQMLEYAGRPKKFSSPEEIIGGLIKWYSLHEEMKELVELATKKQD